MQTLTPPAVGLTTDYTEDHGFDTACPERALWLSVLAQAAADLRDPSVRIRQDAENFFLGADLLRVLDFAGIDHDLAPVVRERAMSICHQPRWSRRRHRVTFQGEARTIEEWGRVTGLSIHTLSHRLRNGWSAARALTTPGRQRKAAQ